MHTTDRVVLVASGFGVWSGGRHGFSARWGDVVRVRAFKRDELTTDVLCVALTLRNGTEVTIHEELPGFDAFLAAAEARLPGMRRRATWWSAVVQPAFAPKDTVLFERDGA